MKNNISCLNIKLISNNSFFNFHLSIVYALIELRKISRKIDQRLIWLILDNKFTLHPLIKTICDARLFFFFLYFLQSIGKFFYFECHFSFFFTWCAAWILNGLINFFSPLFFDHLINFLNKQILVFKFDVRIMRSFKKYIWIVRLKFNIFW